MAKPKYKEYVEKMLEHESQLFTNFKKTHDAYLLNPKGMQEALNKEGTKIMEIIRDWEDKLCRQSEKGGYGSYTTNLAEKFNQEIKKYFPKIDHIGLVIKKMEPLPSVSEGLPSGQLAYEPVTLPSESEGFMLKKIEL